MSELATAAKISAREGYSRDDFVEMMRMGHSDRQVAFAIEKFLEYQEKERMLIKPPKEKHSSPYIRAGILPVEFVLANVGKDPVITPFGLHHGFCSWRIIDCYAKKGVVCAYCGMAGTYFALEKCRHDIGNRHHLNLYHLGKDGKETMMTVDHIHPKVLGGGSQSHNLQPLCAPCNFRKGSKIVGRAA